MTRDEVQKLDLGIFKIFWKEGGCSVGTIGYFANGDRWITPSNWVNIDFNLDDEKRMKVWESVLKVELIEESLKYRGCSAV
jgi:hypothetical protein